MRPDYLQLFTAVVVLLSGMVSYSNLFCGEFHCCAVHEHRHDHHDSQADHSADLGKFLNPFHEQTHTDQFFEQYVFDPASHLTTAAGLVVRANPVAVSYEPEREDTFIFNVLTKLRFIAPAQQCAPLLI